jgi:hypothetical protein
LGMTRARVQKLFTHSSDRGRPQQLFFCMRPIGIRVGFGSAAFGSSYHGRIVWISTSNPRYVLAGVKAGETLGRAERRIAHGELVKVGLNDWYLARVGAVEAVLKVRHGTVQEVGIATRQLTATSQQRRRFVTSFG